MDPQSMYPIFTTPYKQRPLVCLIAASSLHVCLPVLSSVSNMADVDGSKQCSFSYDSFEFPFRFLG